MGSGEWRNSEWSVVFVRSISDSDANDVQLDKMGDYVPVAFAIWDGSNSERDGLKSVTAWHYLKMKQGYNSPLYFSPLNLRGEMRGYKEPWGVYNILGHFLSYI